VSVSAKASQRPASRTFDTVVAEYGSSLPASATARPSAAVHPYHCVPASVSIDHATA
jgi:hypothetical protein